MIDSIVLCDAVCRPKLIQLEKSIEQVHNLKIEKSQYYQRHPNRDTSGFRMFVAEYNYKIQQALNKVDEDYIELLQCAMECD